jgi:hypothetical protein
MSMQNYVVTFIELGQIILIPNFPGVYYPNIRHIRVAGRVRITDLLLYSLSTKHEFPLNLHFFPIMKVKSYRGLHCSGLCVRFLADLFLLLFLLCSEYVYLRPI